MHKGAGHVWVEHEVRLAPQVQEWVGFGWVGLKWIQIRGQSKYVLSKPNLNPVLGRFGSSRSKIGSTLVRLVPREKHWVNSGRVGFIFLH